MTADAFVQLVQSVALAAVRDQRTPGELRFATVDPGYTSGQPRLTFDGETSLSARTYPRLTAAYPTVHASDRVAVLTTANSALILGPVG